MHVSEETLSEKGSRFKRLDLCYECFELPNEPKIGYSEIQSPSGTCTLLQRMKNYQMKESTCNAYKHAYN